MVATVGSKVSSGPAGTVVLDAGGCVVAPGLVDLHTHLREPGREEAETVATGARAAALGGYTAVVAMPNTEPAIDCAAVVRQVLDLGAGACCDVRVAGAITVGRQGRQLAPMAEMAALGVRIFTDDGTGVQDARLMRRAMEYASALGVTLAQHCEDASLAGGRPHARRRVVEPARDPGQPAEAEELMVIRDLALARLTGAQVHFLHLSTAGSLAMVRRGQGVGPGRDRRGGAPPFHPHRRRGGVLRPGVQGQPAAAQRRPTWPRSRPALADGTVDAIATDHAPHAQEAKEVPFDQAPPGMLGLETALALALTELELPDREGPGPDVLAAGRHRRAGRRARRADRRGRPANLCVIDPAASGWSTPTRSASRSRNTPYAGRTLTGRVRHTVLRGEPVVDRRRGAAMTEQDPVEALLVLADGTIVRGRGHRLVGSGARPAPATGEVVFNTTLTGYQEVLTDPSYAGQIITLHLSPHRQLRDRGRRQREPARLLPRPHRAGPGAPAEQLAVASGPWATSSISSGCPASPASTPAG